MLIYVNLRSLFVFEIFVKGLLWHRTIFVLLALYETPRELHRAGFATTICLRHLSTVSKQYVPPLKALPAFFRAFFQYLRLMPI